ncbi:hypothetical protein [Burkholderia cepacia]|uniref:hypothetical protein n=1 Tax=Burkholderia cepacia TaxID=292 RepID=UPI000F5D67C1|nr:hypothetical protein [Burkholderia cepacia]
MTKDPADIWISRGLLLRVVMQPGCADPAGADAPALRAGYRSAANASWVYPTCRADGAPTPVMANLLTAIERLGHRRPSPQGINFEG